MSSDAETRILGRIDEVWGETLSLASAPESSLRHSLGKDSSLLHGVASGTPADAITPTVRRLRPASQAAPDADYRLGDAIGRGGMGVVLSAWQQSVGRRVALKLLRPDRRANAEARACFHAEAALTGALEHPGIVPVYDLGADEDGQSFFAMKLVSGRTWAEAMPSLPLADNIAILIRVAEAVDFAHGSRVIHADLKPANVMLGSYGEVLLLDWGLALRWGSGGARPLAPLAPVGGTPAYMAPEQAVQDLAVISPATDVYLLGAVLYEIAGGRRPHAGNSLRNCLAAAARNDIVPATGDPELMAIARQAMATSPAERHADVVTLIAALRTWRRHADSTALLERARELSAQDASAACADGLRAIDEARALWPANPHAADCESLVRQRWAACALRAGDAGLAVGILRPQVAEEAGLHAEATRLAEMQRRQAVQVRWLRAGAAGLVLVVLIGLVVGRRFVAEAQAAAGEAQRTAESARDQARDGAYLARLAHGVAAMSGGDGEAAEAALSACRPELRGIEWRVLGSRIAETPIPVPGWNDPATCLAWNQDGRRLWVGSRSEVIGFSWPDARIIERHALPSPPAELAAGKAGLLIGMRRGVALLPADGGALRLLTGDGAVQRVALADDGGCLWISDGRAWRWRPGDIEAASVAERAVAVAWQGTAMVVATAEQVLVDGGGVFDAPDGEILGLRWQDDGRFVLLRRGRPMDSAGNYLPRTKPLNDPDAPEYSTYELRTAAGAVVLRAPQQYLDREAAILPGGSGIQVVNGRHHRVMVHEAGRPARQILASETVSRAACSAGGILALAGRGGVASRAITIGPGSERPSGHGVTIALAEARGTVARMDCYGSVSLHRGPTVRVLPRPAGNNGHLGHAAQPSRLQALPDGSFLVSQQASLSRLDADGTLRDLELPSGGSSRHLAPDGARLVEEVPTRRWRILACAPGSPAGPERDGRPFGWVDDRAVLVGEQQDLVAREADTGAERWRLGAWPGAAGRPCVQRAAGRLFLGAGRLIEVRDPGDGRLLATLDRHRQPVTAMTVAAGRLVSGDAEGHLAFWELPSLRPLVFMPMMALPITALAGMDGGLAVGQEEESFQIWGPQP